MFVFFWESLALCMELKGVVVVLSGLLWGLVLNKLLEVIYILFMARVIEGHNT